MTIHLKLIFLLVLLWCWCSFFLCRPTWPSSPRSRESKMNNAS